MLTLEFNLWDLSQVGEIESHVVQKTNSAAEMALKIDKMHWSPSYTRLGKRKES